MPTYLYDAHRQWALRPPDETGSQCRYKQNFCLVSHTALQRGGISFLTTAIYLLYHHSMKGYDD